MRVPRRGTRRANLSSSRLNGTERANSRWPCEKISSSRRSTIASSCPSASIAFNRSVRSGCRAVIAFKGRGFGSNRSNGLGLLPPPTKPRLAGVWSLLVMPEAGKPAAGWGRDGEGERKHESFCHPLPNPPAEVGYIRLGRIKELPNSGIPEFGRKRRRGAHRDRGKCVDRLRSAMTSRRLLRRHLLDLARGEIEAHALDLVEVGAGHPDEAGAVGIVDRMDGAVLIDAGVSRQQAILLDRLELGLFGIGAVVFVLPLDHVGVVRGLAVDRPGRAVVVRRRHPSLVVDMGEDLESELRILVQHLQAARHLLAAIGLDEVAVREQLLEFQANLFAALGAAIAGENGAAIRHKLIEVVGHCCLPGDDMAPSFAHRAGKRQSYGPYDSDTLFRSSRRKRGPRFDPGFPFSREGAEFAARSEVVKPSS